MIQQISQAFYDGETKAETLAAFTRGVVELTILLEDRVKFFLWNARPGIADFDAQHPVAATASEQYFSALGIF